MATEVAAIALRGRWFKHTYPREGWPRLLAPSAARPEGKILCLFRDSAGVHGAKPLGKPRRISEPPAPPTGLQT